MQIAGNYFDLHPLKIHYVAHHAEIRIEDFGMNNVTKERGNFAKNLDEKK